MLRRALGSPFPFLFPFRHAVLMSNQRYLVTARKYRPQLFGEVVAQEHVTETLQNAIRLDRLAHAYLFSGPRGVGKTTAARILAKAINCTTPPEDRADSAEPCRQCDSCRSFEEGRNLNIIEIDAASNNKVEDVRDLRDTVRIPPQGNRKKVYIIDEVHMLSNAAFNALLKTLEEPPPYALFIFATTEPHKVLPTILSRCQRFDFRRIAVPEIVAQLQKICVEEAITADEASLMLIARKGDGALRDALSVFDQAVSLCGTALQHAELIEALGVVDTDHYFTATHHVQTRESAGMIHLVDTVVRAGYDLQEFLDGLAEHLRNLLVALTMPDTDLIEAPAATRQRYLDESRYFAEQDLLRLLMIVDEAEEALKSSRQPRLRLEMALLKMAALNRAADLREALAKLDRLETMVREGKVPEGLTATLAPPPTSTKPPASPPKPPAATAPKAAEQPPVKQAVAPPEPPPSRPEPHSQPQARLSQPPPPPEPSRQHAPPPQPQPSSQAPMVFRAEEDEEHDFYYEAPTYTEKPAGDGDARRPAASGPAATGSMQAPARTAPTHPELPASGDLFGPPALKKKPSPRNAAPVAPQGLQTDEEAGVVVLEAPEITASPLLQRVVAAWPSYLQAVKADRIHVGALLQHTTPLDARGTLVDIAVPDAFHQRLLHNQHDFLVTHLKEQIKEEVTRLQFTVQAAMEATAQEETTDEFDPYAYMQRKQKESPVLRALFEQFGGEIVW